MIDRERYAREALERGLYVVKADGSEVAIPPVLEPTVADLDDLSADARVLVRAAARAADRLDIDALGSATPLERECLEARRGRDEPLVLATARVDFMAGRALEVNATIPAMQGYADIVAEAFFEAAGRPELTARNGRNTDDLASALAELGGRRIAIVAREGDAQRGELLHYVRRMAERGLEPRLVSPDRIRIVRGALEADGQRVDLTYRHIFAWRLDPACDFARALREPWRYGVVNPVALDIEAKATLAELSRAADERESWLPRDEAEVVQRRVPWTRRLDPTTAGRAERERERMVLKRSWDYGGRAVHLGIDIERERWMRLLDEALRPGDIWVVQERVEVPVERRTIVGSGTVDCYVDLCAFTSLGVRTLPRGGASRVARSRIVNILGGGGLAPVLKPDVAQKLGF